MAFEAFAFATPLILNVFVADNHSLQTGNRFNATVMINQQVNHILCYIAMPKTFKFPINLYKLSGFVIFNIILLYRCGTDARGITCL
jgi:hypothetical protein